MCRAAQGCTVPDGHRVSLTPVSCTSSSHLVFGGHLRRSRTTSQGNTGGHLHSPGPGFPPCLCVANFSLPSCGYARMTFPSPGIEGRSCLSALLESRSERHRIGDRDQGPGAKGALRV